MKIQIKHRFFGNILFELEKDNNTIKITLETGISTNANLEGADLEGADLRGAYLRSAYLEGADLEDANLRGADLRGAYLRSAYLEGADLRGADLEGADLRGAYLRGADLRGADLEEVKTPPINDHQFASEILWKAAKTETQKDFAARVRLETNQCWKFFFKLAKKKKVDTWAKQTLNKWEEYKTKTKEIQSK